MRDMEKKLKILYFMNVDWSWIRQRPHIIAQMLDQKYDLTVLYPAYLTRPWRMQKKTQKTNKCIGIFHPPFETKIIIFQNLIQKKIRKIIGRIDQYDVIWLSSPEYIIYVPDNYKGKIIYDNMDDIVKLQTDNMMANKLKITQDIALERAAAVLVTSNYLYNKLPEKIRGKAHLIRNGCLRSQIFEIENSVSLKKQYSIGYIGTISEWFDFELLLKFLRKNAEFNLELFGPNLIPIPNDQRIHLNGVIEHDRLPEAVENIDCLIMPFLLNEITLAVDPVKLYEYIGFGKCIVSIRYPEIERFEPFVYFYDNEEQFNNLMEGLKRKGFPPKYNSVQQNAFLLENSWEKRIIKIERIINSLMEVDIENESNECIWNKA